MWTPWSPRPCPGCGPPRPRSRTPCAHSSSASPRSFTPRPTVVDLGMDEYPVMESATPRRKFLPEIQALRALAVLLVVAYHLEPRWLPGGFVGVDVFFVISGFLITGHMLRDAAATGTISLRSFWAARIRRILPAALLVIAVVLAATLALLPMSQWERIGGQALA